MANKGRQAGGSKAKPSLRRNRAALAQGKRATIKDVARHAGVGPITVSRVLRDPDKVSAILKKRVLTAIDDLGYIANQVASGLASGASRIVPVLIPTLAHPVYVPFLDGVHAELDRHGYEVLLGTTDYLDATEARLVTTFLGWFPAGLLIAGVDHAEVTRRRLEQAVNEGIPVVEFIDLTDDPIDMNIGYSHFASGETVARFFADRGHRHIAYVGTLSELDLRGARRLAGFQSALRERGLPGHYEFRSSESFSIGLGSRLLNELLLAHPQIEAIFFGNDDLAAGAVLEARRRGISIPDRLAIMGNNDMEISTMLEISTVNIDQMRMGRIVAQHLVEALEGRPNIAKSVDTGFQIIERGTTRNVHANK